MFPTIYTKQKGIEVVIEANQYAQGDVRYFNIADADLTGVSARYIISDPASGVDVSDCCAVKDAHTVAFTLPFQIVANPGTYEAQIVLYTKEYLDDSFEAWKADVLAGKTPVLVQPSAETTATEERAANALPSFVFKVKVYKAPYLAGNKTEIGSDVQTILNSLQAKTEELETSISANASAIASADAKAEANASGITNLSAADAELENKITTGIDEVKTQISTAESATADLADRLTNLEAGGAGPWHYSAHYGPATVNYPYTADEVVLRIGGTDNSAAVISVKNGNVQIAEINASNVKEAHILDAKTVSGKASVILTRSDFGWNASEITQPANDSVLVIPDRTTVYMVYR